MLIGSLLATTAAIAIAVWSVVQAWFDLSAPAQPIDESRRWQVVVLANFGPWVLLALAGITFALINLRLEPQLTAAREAHPKLITATKRVGKFRGIEYRSVASLAMLSFTTNIGREQVIVISTAALDSLSNEELDAVLWHEVAHIRLGHNRLKRSLGLFANLTSRFLASRVMAREIEQLCELAADKYAQKHTNRQVLLAARAKFGA
jgi:Zn-dependent protease with chaperone function